MPPVSLTFNNNMIYPNNFEQKIGFDTIRTLLKGRCISTLGTEWIDNQLKFMPDYAGVKEALAQAGEFKSFMETADDVCESNFFDVRHALLRIRPERTYMEELELYDLMRSLKSVADLVAYFRRCEEESATGKEGNPYPALCRMSHDVAVFPDIVRQIDNILNKYGKMKDTASEQLQAIRQQLEQASRNISHVLRTIVNEARTAGYIERDVSPTVRDGRMVIPVSPSAKRKIKGIIHDESATGKTVFIEPAAVVEANNRVRELKAEEQREIIRILHEITAAVRPHVTEMLESLHYLAHIDYLRALTVFSAQFQSIIPEVEDVPLIKWHAAIHPLLRQSLEKHGKQVVPLDINLRDGQRILLISGPNAGGKSVCLKTVGLLQYMMQCGMPVPLREDSVMGIFEDIFIDIGDEQSLEDELSTYSGHLQNMKQMMKSGSARSLLLIDEFGSGTEPLIGGAIAEAVLDRLVQKQVSGIITTHYQNLKQYAQAHPAVVNGAMLYDRANMQPLFRLQIGTPGSSFAIEIARKIGLPADVIDAATQIAGAEYIQTDKYVQDINRDKAYWENKRKNIRNQEKQLQENMARYQHDMETLQAQRREIIAQAKAEAQEMLRQSNAQIENTIRQIKEAQAERETTQEARTRLESYKQSLASAEEQDAAIARKIEQIRRRAERRKERRANAAAGTPDKQPGKAAEKPRALQAGNTVHIDGQNTVGQIVRIEGKRAYVQYGSMTARVELSRLRPATAPSPTPSAPSPNAPTISAALHAAQQRFHPDIDIRGQHVDEALPVLARYIDDAIQLGQPRVRILHGTGTGALREAVRNYLASVPGVRDFRDEHVQFGGAGITVVDLD